MKPNESQFSVDSAVDKNNAESFGKQAGYYPKAYIVSELQEKAKEGTPGSETPISGAALAKGAKERKDYDATPQGRREKAYEDMLDKKAVSRPGSGIIQGGKLIKGGNKELKEKLSRGKN